MQIGNRQVTNSNPVFIIAEAGANHNGSLTTAKEMVLAAKNVGADCIKFQTFTAEEFCLDPTKKFTYLSQSSQVTESEFEMFKRLEFSKEQWGELVAFCSKEKIQFLTTIQDPINLEMMQSIGIEAIKIGSDDFDHLVNLRKYAKTGLPLIVSKGMTTESESEFVINELQSICKNGLAILHCVSLYPADDKYLNLSQIKTLKGKYPNIIFGFSDHSESVVAPALAVALGAKIIEKHFTLDNNLPGPDHWFSMNPSQFKEMVQNIRHAERSLGDGSLNPSEKEMSSKAIMRRRVLAISSLREGETLSEDSVNFKRANSGAYAGEWHSMIGKKLLVAKNKNDPIYIGDLES